MTLYHTSPKTTSITTWICSSIQLYSGVNIKINITTTESFNRNDDSSTVIAVAPGSAEICVFMIFLLPPHLGKWWVGKNALTCVHVCVYKSLFFNFYLWNQLNAVKHLFNTRVVLFFLLLLQILFCKVHVKEQLAIYVFLERLAGNCRYIHSWWG